MVAVIKDVAWTERKRLKETFFTFSLIPKAFVFLIDDPQTWDWKGLLSVLGAAHHVKVALQDRLCGLAHDLIHWFVGEKQPKSKKRRSVCLKVGSWDVDERIKVPNA